VQASQSQSGCLLSWLAGIFASLFVLSTPFVALLATGDLRMLQPDPYKQALVEQNVYDRLPALLAEQLVYSGSISPSGEENGESGQGDTGSQQAFISDVMFAASPDLSICLQDGLGPTAYGDLRGQSRDATPAEANLIRGCLRSFGVPASVADSKVGMPVFFWLLDEAEWLDILEAVLPPDWLRTQTESVIDQAFAALRSDEAYPVLRVPTAELKTRIVGAAGYDALVSLIDAQPPCDQAQLAQIAALVDPNEPFKDIPVCRPPQEMLDAIAPNIRATLALLAQEMPDNAEFKLVDEEASSGGGFEALRGVVQATDTVSRFALLVPIVLLALVAALAVRSVRSLLVWWGVPLLLAGGAGVALAAISLSIEHSALGPMGEGAGTLSPGLVNLARDTARSLADGFLFTYGLAMLVVALVGLGMVVGFVVMNRNVAQAAPVPPAGPTWGPPPPPPDQY
jgi:hypothetical protein